MLTVLFSSVLAVNYWCDWCFIKEQKCSACKDLNTSDNPWPRWHKPYVSTEVTNLSSQGVIRANMSISMTAVVNIYSVCGGVETSREGEEDKRSWHFPKSKCVSCSSMKTGQPCMFAAKRKQLQQPGPKFCLFTFTHFSLSAWKKKKTFFLSIQVFKKTRCPDVSKGKHPKMKHIIKAFLFVAAWHYRHPQPGFGRTFPTLQRWLITRIWKQFVVWSRAEICSFLAITEN